MPRSIVTSASYSPPMRRRSSPFVMPVQPRPATVSTRWPWSAAARSSGSCSSRRTRTSQQRSAREVERRDRLVASPRRELAKKLVRGLSASAVSGGLILQARAEAPPPTRQLSVNGVELSYIEQGTGTPVVFVHGAFSDVRFWEPQRQAVAKHYRFVAYNYRYHGAAPWPDDGKQYSAATHAADLAAFIRRLNAGPVHLVGLSHGGLLPHIVASEQPELVRSLTLAEPAIGVLLMETPAAKPALDDRCKAMASIAA